MKKRILSSLLALFLVLAFGACGEDISTPEPNAEAGTWAIYWYLCGSDLESNGGFATSDLMEMMEVALPENVRVVIQTGGAKTWQNNVVDADILQRYVYDSEGLTLVDELPPASMGDAATLTDFLRYCKQNYPAEKTAVLFWNHGGGSVSGAAFDERYGYDSLTLDEMQTAFGRVWEADENNPPLELVGFDTCLMATVDVAGTFAGTAHYLVASEEVEPANGWDYTGWLGALAADPAMDGAALGEVICDAYYAGCQAVGTHSNATLSLTDLTRTGPLLVDENGVSHLTLGPEADSILAGIGFSLYYFDEENDIMLLLGTDNDMNADWENGVFSDNFRGVWGGIDGHMVYMELCFEGEDYNLYSVPVLLNGEPYNLQVAYDFTTEEWSILGARQGIGEAGMSDKELRLLQPGDTLTTIWYLSSYSGEDGLEAYAVEELTVTADTAFAEMELPNGRYGMVFEMRDAMDNYAYSDSVFFLCEDGKISTLIYE